jgi:dephospho-CoA kinase
MKLIGLTGGIGSGKSTVAALLAARGVPILDADQLAREVVAPGGPAYRAVADAWPAAIGPDGGIDRKRLGAIIFADPAARARLEAITHPHIQELSQRRAAALAAGGHPFTIYEASLLVESGRHRELDGLIVVRASPEAQVARVVRRDGLSEREARARIDAQLPLADKLRVATHVIDNDGDLAATEAQVDRLLVELRRG